MVRKVSKGRVTSLRLYCRHCFPRLSIDGRVLPCQRDKSPGLSLRRSGRQHSPYFVCEEEAGGRSSDIVASVCSTEEQRQFVSGGCGARSTAIKLNVGLL